MKKFTTKDGFVFNTNKGKRPLKLNAEDYGLIVELVPVEMHMLENGAKDGKESLIFVSYNPDVPFMAVGQLSLDMWKKGLEKIGYTITKLKK